MSSTIIQIDYYSYYKMSIVKFRVWCKILRKILRINLIMETVRILFLDYLINDRTIGPCREFNVKYLLTSQKCTIPLDHVKTGKWFFFINCKWTGPLDHVESWKCFFWLLEKARDHQTMKIVWCEIFWYLENVQYHWTMYKLGNGFFIYCKWAGPSDHAESLMWNLQISQECTGPLDHVESLKCIFWLLEKARDH
jgi:hypothetical protein